MQKGLIAAILMLLALWLVRPADVQAEELKGRVVSVSGGEARLELDGEFLPNEGDPVAFSYELPGMDMLARAGTGKVTGFEGATVIVLIDAGKSAPQAGFLATVTSPSPRKREFLSPKEALAGNWISQSPEGPAVLILRADGTGSANGTELQYECTATSLTVTIKGETDKLEYQLRADVLILSEEGHPKDAEFRRANDETAREALRKAQEEEKEIDASVVLDHLAFQQALFRELDLDANGVEDYWTRDVAGLHFIQDGTEQPIQYIDVDIAKADRLGLAHYTKEPPSPNRGYWLRAIKTDETGAPYIDESLPRPGAKPVTDRASTNRSKFAFCSYPAEYGVTGVSTYIVNEEGILYKKDLGPDATEGCDRWPAADPTTRGWSSTGEVVGGATSEASELYKEGHADEALARIGEVGEGTPLAALKKRIMRVSNAYRDALAAEARKDHATARRWWNEIVSAEEDRDNFYRMVADQKAGLDPAAEASDLTRKADLQAAYRKAVSRYEAGAFEDAAKLFHKSAEMKFEPAASFYYEACSWALAGNAPKALAALEQAIKAGYDDVDHMEEDADLQSLHGNEAFQRMLAKLRE